MSDDQVLIDKVCHYRNLAIECGAEPAHMLDGYDRQGRSAKSEVLSTLDPRPSSPALGFFARMCREKGLPDKGSKDVLIQRLEAA